MGVSHVFKLDNGTKSRKVTLSTFCSDPNEFIAQATIIFIHLPFYLKSKYRNSYFSRHSIQRIFLPTHAKPRVEPTSLLY